MINALETRVMKWIDYCTWNTGRKLHRKKHTAWCWIHSV